MREIVIDTETTGLKPEEGNRMIEIACVEMVNLYPTGRHFHTYLNPEAAMSEGAYKVHGISLDFLKDKPIFAEKAAEFIEFVGDSRMVIHNAPFDMGFINYQLNLLGIQPIPMAQVFDTLSYARQKFPGGRHNLDALCDRFGVNNKARDKHGALLDAELLADVYSEMMGAGSRQRNIMFLNQESSEKKEAQTKIEQPKIFREPRVFQLTEEELSAHAKMVDKLKNPIWKELAEA